MIYLDNSATSYPKPESVYKAMDYTTKYYFANPGRGGYDVSLKTAEKIYEVREKLADFFGAPAAENCMFTYNCTAAINTVIKGILNSGDHVLISDLEHNSVVRPLEKLKRESSIKYDIFKTDIYNSDKTIDNIKSLLKAETKLIICTHASNVIGASLPVEKIGKLCKEKDIYFALDCAQSGGILPLDMKESGVNFLCLAGHKGLFGAMGTGVLISDGSEVDSLLEGGTGSNSKSLLQPEFMPDKLEAGTANVSGIISIGAGIDFIKKIGREKIKQKEENHILQLNSFFKEEEKIVTYANYEKMFDFAPVISFNIKGAASEEVANFLAQNDIAVRAGLHCSPLAHKKIGTYESGTVRISPSYFTTNSEINYTIRTIKKAISAF